jgi:hypothetical protein
LETGPGKSFLRSISKITRAKWTGGMAQVVETLLFKCKALNSNPGPTTTTTKKKIKKQYKKGWRSG